MINNVSRRQIFLKRPSIWGSNKWQEEEQNIYHKKKNSNFDKQSVSVCLHLSESH